MESEYKSEMSVVHNAIKQAVASVEKPTAEKLAKATFAALQKIAVEPFGMSANEVRLIAPGEKCYFDNRTPQWVVSWEAGPYQWAIGASFLFPQVVEPYYSFDLCFYPAEDKA